MEGKKKEELKTYKVTVNGNPGYCGEGAGYAGGIVSAGIDGERCAEAVADYFNL